MSLGAFGAALRAQSDCIDVDGTKFRVVDITYIIDLLKSKDVVVI